MRPSQTRSLLAAAAAVFAAAAGAASQWEPVAAVKGQTIELDKARIARKADGKATAWSRVPLERDLIDEQGMRYTAIEAFNRYDCLQRSFATLKRIYRRDGRVVREEAVADVRELPVQPNSADERLFLEVCKTQAADARSGKPGPMYADMRMAQAATPTRPQQVAERPETKPAETKPVEKPERPRYIDLPKIDKSQLEDSNPKPADAKAAEAKPADAKAAADAKRAPDAKTPVRPVEKPLANRQELERLYATSGPRKAAPKKKAPEPAEPTLAQRGVHWSYDGEGGPGNWDKLRGEYALCGAGKRQSPIDIRESIKVDLEPIAFDYKPTHFRITDNGHTVQVDVGEGNSIKIMERQFELVQFHFHRPAEERVYGKAYDMVAHLVHKDLDGKLAVIAVLLEKGSEHPLIQTLWNHMPLERGMSVEPGAVIDLNALLPPLDRRAYFTYMGSLTTPPCSEDVLWMVFKQPQQVSPQQVSIFSRLYANNARPVQPSNGRLVKETR